MLLILSGNVQPNSCPTKLSQTDTPAEFKRRSGLGIIQLNVCSLFAKINLIHIWLLQLILMFMLYQNVA